MNSHIKNTISSLGNLLLHFNKKNIDRREIRKILIMSLYFRGDVLFCTAAVKLLRNIFPDAIIEILVKSRSREVLEGNPSIDRIIVFDDIKTADYNDSSGLRIKEKYRLLKTIREQEYDLCIDFTGKYSTALFALLGGFKYSFGINYNGFGFCYSKFVNINTQNTKGLLSDKYSNILKEGLQISEAEWAELSKDINGGCEIYLSSDDIETAANALSSLNLNPDKPLICIQVTAGWKAKEWSEDKYSDLIKKFIRSGCSYVLIGSEEDKEINFKILDSVSPDLREHYLSLPLKVNAAVIKLSDLFIGSDSIGLHLAGAVETASIGLFGPTNPAFSNPAGESHIVIYRKLFCSAAEDSQYCTRNAGKTCPSIDCLKSITPDEVMQSAEFLLGKYFHKKRITA
jgi:ADP-heptose:LPS heptosyltransferase